MILEDYQNINRNLIAAVEFLEKDLDEIKEIQKNLSICIDLRVKKLNSSQMAALLSAVACIHRTFEVRVPCIGQKALEPNEELTKKIKAQGGYFSDSTGFKYRLIIGEPPSSKGEIELISNGWQGGINLHNEGGSYVSLNEGVPNIPLGGVTSAALAVFVVFMDHFGIKDIDRFEDSPGYSLWQPTGEHWFSEERSGKPVGYCPKRIWLAGLGHVGQGFLWTLSFFDFNELPDILIQDDDKSDSSNFATQILTKEIGKRKTRICMSFLESHGFETTILEKKLTPADLKDSGLNKFNVLVTAFDNILSRQFLDSSDFDLLVDIGVGSAVESFDSITLHNLSVLGKSGKEIWDFEGDKPEATPYFEQLVKSKDNCGKVASIATPFVGLIASAFAIAEIFRAYNYGPKLPLFSTELRDTFQENIDWNVYGDEMFCREYLKYEGHVKK